MAKGTGWFGAGLFTFGLSLGAITGASSTSGISQALLSALFSFVGGVLLAYNGFRKKAAAQGTETEPDLQATGLGLTCFSLGVLTGLCAGIGARLHWVEAQRATAAAVPTPVDSAKRTAASGAPPVASSPASKPEPLLYAGPVGLCTSVRSGEYASDAATARSQLKAFYHAYCPGPDLPQ